MASKIPTSAQSQLALLFDVKRPASSKAVRASDGVGIGRTWLVHQLVSEAREMMEQEYGDIWVEGEISNCRPASSGHCYFTLKDAEAQLSVVMFRRQAMLMRFKPADGLHVRVRGKVSVYDQRGQLQLIAETVEPVGSGSLQLAFEQLRDKLRAEGLFDADRKRPLPAFPRTVAVITSPDGAAIQDFLNIVRRRHSGLSVVVVPVVVQGENAAYEIEAALREINRSGIADLIVLARGGGSLEDLAAFNSERVARAIAASTLAVVSAIGHETDVTIADFAADLRAPTPSAAAELVTEAQHRVGEWIAGLTNRLIRATRFQVLQSRQKLDRVPVVYTQQRLVTLLHRLEQRLDDLVFRLEAAMSEMLRRDRIAVEELSASVSRHDPRQRLHIARAGLDSWQVRMEHAVDRGLRQAVHQRKSLEDRLFRASVVHLAERRSVWTNLRGQMQSLSPLAVLQRGYALVQDESGVVVRSAAQLTANQHVVTRLGTGSFSSQILKVDTMTEQADSTRKKEDK